MGIKDRYYSFLITGLAVIFVAVGNWVYQPVYFDIGLKAATIKIFWAALGMLVLPLLAIRYVFKKERREFGFTWPVDVKKSLKLIGVCLAANLPILFVLARLEEFQFYYRLFDYSLKFFILSGIIGGLVYYLAEEFLFRGFLFLGLFNQIGSKSYLVTSLIFAAAHWGKSYIEIIYSFGISWWLCWLSLKTKSFLPAAAAHFALALILNYFVNYLVVG